MALILPTFPGEPDKPITIELEGRDYILRYRWSERRAGWYIDLLTEDGEPIMLGRRLCPRERPLEGVADDRAPPGVLVVTGPDAYFRDDLGASLLLMYVEAEAVPRPEPLPLVIS